MEFALSITRKAEKELKELMSLVGVESKGELIRQALKLYDYCIRAKKAGAQIIIRYPNEKEDSSLTDL